MNKKLTAKLNEKYPKMFLFHNFRNTNHFVFECRDGWYNILNAMFQGINNYVQHNNDRYWKFDEAETLIDNKRINLVPHYLLSQIEAIKNGNGEFPVEIDFPTIRQVKEKFGTLRVYLDNYDDVIAEISNFAATMSVTTCEECGNIGERRKLSWIKTLCDEHHALRLQEIKVRENEITSYMAGDKGPV